MDDALLYAEMAKAKRPADWAVVGTAQSKEAYGCACARTTGKVVDEAIASKTSGRGAADRQAADLGQGLQPTSQWFHYEGAALRPNDKAFE